VLPVLACVDVYNEGAAFSFLADAGGWQRWLFVLLAIAFSAWIVYELARLPAGERMMRWAFALVLGGALGNLVDRVLLGHVVDFVLVHWRDWYFPAFNLADAAITVGAALWILRAVLGLWGDAEDLGGGDRADGAAAPRAPGGEGRQGSAGRAGSAGREGSERREGSGP